MKKDHSLALVLALAALLIVPLAACKTSGMAVTEKGQLLKINIDSPTDLSEGETRQVVVEISNRGVTKANNVVFEVEMPNELIVLSEVHGNGMTVVQRRTPNNTNLYFYSVGDINVGETSRATFHVRAAFGTLERTGDIRVTAYNQDLPGNKLVETKFVKLRR